MKNSGLTKQALIDKIKELESEINTLKSANQATETVNPLALAESREKLGNSGFYGFTEDSSDMYFNVKTDGTIISVNEKGASSLGYKVEELVGDKVWKIVRKDDLEYVKRKITEIIDKKEIAGRLEFWKKRKDGTLLYVQEITQLIRQKGVVKGLKINCRDITLQKIALDSLKEQEEKYRTLANNLNVGIYRSTADEQGRFLEINPAFIKMFGYDLKEEMFENNVSELYKNSGDRFKLQKDLKNNGFVKNREVLLQKKNGDTFIGSLSTVAIKDEKGEIKFYDGIVEDITERKKATEEIIRMEEQYRTLFNLSPYGILIEDNKGAIIDVNPAFCQMVKYSKEELIGIHVSKLSFSDKPDVVDDHIRQLLGGEMLKHITRSRCKDGTSIYTELHERSFELEGTVGIICIAEDVSERIKSQEILKQSEVSYRGLFNSTTDAIYIQDKEGRFVDVNKGAEQMYGYHREYFIGKTPEFLSAPGYNDLDDTILKLNKAFAGEPQTFEFWGIDKNKRIFPKEVRMSKGIYFGKEVVVVFAQDITERKAAQKSLEEKEKKLRSIFNAFPDIYFKSDIEGVVKEISPSVSKIAGYTPEQIIGRKSSEFYHSRHEWEEIGEMISGTGEIKDYDTRIKCPDGSIINCSLTAHVILDQDQNPVEIEGVLRDITDRKKAEVALRESNRRLSTLMDNLPGMAYRCKNDKKWTMEFVSSGCRNLTGYEPGDIIGNKKISFNDIIHPDDRDLVWNEVQPALNKRSSYRMTYRIVTTGKKIKWVWEQGTGIFDQNGEFIALEGFITDITEQKKAEGEIRKLSRSVDQSPNIVIISDLNAKIEYVNPRFTKVTGYTAEEVIGKNPKILKSGNTPKETYKAMWEKLTSGQEWSGELQNKKKNGELFWESANILPLKNNRGEMTHYIGMKEDITERKKMEKELIVAKEKAEESDRLKSAFLANMSHEIRTPMNAIIGFSQLLNDESLSESEKSHFIDLIQGSGNDLLRLIDDIIDISKIEAGQLKVHKSQYFLDNILQGIYISYNELLKTKPEKSGLKLQYNPPANNKIVIYTDIDRFKQILRNLLSNAIKFTNTGLIEFGFNESTDSNKPVIEFYVSDTGIGIAEDKHEIIFESFRQANDSDTQLYGGTGLGLAITRRMVEILGGEIRVKSVKNQGSTFYFTIPYQKNKSYYFQDLSKPSSPIENELLNIDWKDKKVLIVEDDDNSFIYFKNILSKTKIRIFRAQDGIDALDKVMKNEFNIILMDIRIPKLNGYATTRRIKKIRNDLPVIAQTAYAMEGEREKAIKAGCDDYIAKPVQINKLLKLIDRYII